MRSAGRAGHDLEIPQGPVRSFEAPGGQRLAIYELTRPGVIESFAGRRDSERARSSDPPRPWAGADRGEP